MLVSGDSEGILGVTARRLINSPDPLTLLPSELSTILSIGLPEAPIHVSTSSFAGSVSTIGGSAELILFDTPDLQDGVNIMLDELGAGVVGTDRTGSIVLWNKAMSSIFRIPQKHAIGKQIQDVLVSPVLYSWENVIQMVLDGKQIRVECRPDGQRRVESTFSPGGSGVVGTCFDTTESFQAESRLRTSRKMNKAYFHSVSTGLVLFDKDYRILVANRAFGQMFGLVENLLGIHLNEILPRECFRIVEDQAQPLFSDRKKEKEISRIVRFTLPDQTRRVILQDIRPIIEDSGDIYYAVGIFEDISEKSILHDNYQYFREKIRQIYSLSSILNSGKLVNLDMVSETLRECFSAKAVAIYISNSLVDTELAGKTTEWPDDAPEVFSELRFSSFMLESQSGYQLSGDETGVLSSWFKKCQVFPIESDKRNYGYIIVADVDDTAGSEIILLAEIATQIIQFSLSINENETEIEQLNLLLTRQSKLAGTVIETLDIPVAVFRSDWSVILWNDPMEELTGVSLDFARSRPELAANILFDGIGGISSAQRFTRQGMTGFPESWEVKNQDGSVLRCAWRLSRTESVESGNLEPVVIIAGIKSDDVFSINAAKKAANMYTALSRGTSALLSASDRLKVEEAAASAFLEISGASRITLDIRGMNPITRTSYDQKQEAIASRPWKLLLETDTDIIGECVFHGGKEYPVLSDFARNVARTCAELEKNAIGRRFTFLTERAAGKFLISNSSGKIVLSTWMQVTDGVTSHRTIYDVFSGSDWSFLNSRILGVLKYGRLNMQLRTPKGEALQVTAAALDGHNGESLIIWWPVSASSYMSHIKLTERSMDSGIALRDLIDNLSISIGRGFTRIREALNPDHPVAAVLNTAKYAFDGITKGNMYLRFLDMAWNHIPERIDPEFFLDKVKSAFLADGMLSPDISISGDLYDIYGDAELLQKTTLQICRVICPDGVPAFGISLVNRKDIDSHDDLPKDVEQYVRVILRESEGNFLSVGFDDLSELSTTIDYSSGLDPATEISLLSTILKLSGGVLMQDDESNSLVMLLPCWK